ncbi:hypothetical protein, partial [Caballeronia sp. GaOx3]|uniref:hypothetical protein n=1 Tax=Caballeronia sp. GaOx3 TaxID=2921740 RepID=UPI0020296F48
MELDKSLAVRLLLRSARVHCTLEKVNGASGGVLGNSKRCRDNLTSLHKPNYRIFECSGNILMSCSSKIEMSCFAAGPCWA